MHNSCSLISIMLHYVQHYANEVARVVQVLYKSRRVSVILFYSTLLQLSERCNKVTKTTVDGKFYVMLFYFILLQTGEPLNRRHVGK